MEINLTELVDLMRPTGHTVTTDHETIGDQITGDVIIRTVTHYFTGRVVAETDRWLLITEAAWIADTGRWADALKTGKLNEVEPYPVDDVIRVGIGAIVDIAPWHKALPTEQK